MLRDLFAKRDRIRCFRQLDQMDCGPTCIRMIAHFFGREYTLEYLRSISGITKQGVSFWGLSQAAKTINLITDGLSLTVNQLNSHFLHPCILHWNSSHFVVLFKVEKDKATGRGNKYLVADPSHGIVTLDESSFVKGWLAGKERGVALSFKPGPDFMKVKPEHNKSQTHTPVGFIQHIRPYKKFVLLVAGGMLLSSLLTLMLPFLTQSLVDFGINRGDRQFVSIILISQLIVFIGSFFIDLVRNWILLNVNVKVSISIISTFLDKLMRLSVSFFDSRNTSDITQRISDHSRVESFLTGATLGTIFSLAHMIIFSVVLAYYNFTIFILWTLGSVASVMWVCYFLKKREELNYLRFRALKENQNLIYEMIDGMGEIKLNGWQFAKRKRWEEIQASLFRVNSANLSLEQTQELGSNVILQVKNFFISFLAANAVIQTDLTLGQMLSISFIVGQMNGPLAQLIAFVRNFQDVRISLDRLNEVQYFPDEQKRIPVSETVDQTIMPAPSKNIVLDNVSFYYGDLKTKYVLRDINIVIPEGKITAIVGSSGSGKTTLLKLLLKFYEPVGGSILIDQIRDLRDIDPKEWRYNCGAVLQAGTIFSDTISNNVALPDEDRPVNHDRVTSALEVANLTDFVNSLPLRQETHIGNAGLGLSGGQKQRILIARAVYRNPAVLFFDEATSSLDANNEKVIMHNLLDVYEGKTVVIIAHRLSTVMNAHQIVVLEDGKVVELGNHQKLVRLRGKYFELVRNQLDLEVAS